AVTETQTWEPPTSRTQLWLLTGFQSLSLLVFGFAALTTPVREARSSLTGIVFSTSGSRARWGNLATISRPGTGKLAFVIPETRDRICPSAKLASPDCEPRSWIRTQPRRL